MVKSLGILTMPAYRISHLNFSPVGWHIYLKLLVLDCVTVNGELLFITGQKMTGLALLIRQF